LQLTGSFSTAEIQAGNGGGVGGHGGSIVGSTIVMTTGANLSLLAGEGASSTSGNGGNGGSILNTALSGLINPLTVVAQMVAQAGAGGSGHGPGAVGGSGGAISNFVMDPSLAGILVEILGGDGGEGENDADGGDGGSLIDVVARFTASASVSPGLGGLGEGAGQDGADGLSTNVQVIPA
jgi:hypothetical protein